MYHTEKKKVSCEAISYGRFLKTVNVRFRTAKPIINPYRHENGKFCKPIFSDVFLWDGLQPEMEPHFRTTSASETGVWMWVSTHRGRPNRSNEPKTVAQQHKPHLPSTSVSHCPTPRRARLRHPHEPMESNRSDGVDYESLASVLAVVASAALTKHSPSSATTCRGQGTVGVWENLLIDTGRC